MTLMKIEDWHLPIISVKPMLLGGRSNTLCMEAARCCGLHLRKVSFAVQPGWPGTYLDRRGTTLS